MYESETCYTAKELREMGINIPLEIPDCAWVPKSAVRWDVKAASSKFVVEKLEMHTNIPVHVDVDFQWLSIEVTEDDSTQRIVTIEHSACLSSK